MALRKTTDTNDRATIRRTLHYFWWVTRQRPGAFALSIISSVGYIALLTFANTYVMGRIVDRVQASPVAADQVFSVFGPYILALLVVNVVGQTLSKLQDYSVYRLEINANYQLSRLCFDTLSNQSMTFHNSRFGGSLVSQTSRFVYSSLFLLWNLNTIVYILLSGIGKNHIAVIGFACFGRVFGPARIHGAFQADDHFYGLLDEQ